MRPIAEMDYELEEQPKVELVQDLANSVPGSSSNLLGGTMSLFNSSMG